MSSTTGRRLFVVTMVVFAAVMSAILKNSVVSGQRVASVIWVLVTSAGLMLIVWLLVQRRQPALKTFRWRTISYAAVLGDTLALTTIMAFDATGWQYYGDTIAPFWKHTGWTGLAFVIGLAVGVYFHISGGQADSNSHKLSERLHDSGTSWAHNVGVVTAVTSVLVRTLVPLFTVSGGRVWAMWSCVVLVFGWFGLVVVDEIRRRRGKFNPHWLDTEMNWAKWRPRRLHRLI